MTFRIVTEVRILVDQDQKLLPDFLRLLPLPSPNNSTFSTSASSLCEELPDEWKGLFCVLCRSSKLIRSFGGCIMEWWSNRDPDAVFELELELKSLGFGIYFLGE